MRTVSENSEADLTRKRASAQVAWTIRELTANLLRITRGAGKPYEVMRQMADLAEAIKGYQAATGLSSSPDEFARALDVSNDQETMQHWSAEDRHRDDAEGRIIRGVLQVVASRLVKQKTQETVGRHDMLDGLRALEDLRAEVRRARARDARQISPSANAAKGHPVKQTAKTGRPRAR
jgi:hypothetical protein